MNRRPWQLCSLPTVILRHIIKRLMYCAIPFCGKIFLFFSNILMRSFPPLTVYSRTWRAIVFSPQSCSIETCSIQNRRKAVTGQRSSYRRTCPHKCKNCTGSTGSTWWPATVYRWTGHCRTSVKNRNCLHEKYAFAVNDEYDPWCYFVSQVQTEEDRRRQAPV